MVAIAPLVRIEVEAQLWSFFSFVVHVDAKVPQFDVSRYRIEAKPIERIATVGLADCRLRKNVIAVFRLCRQRILVMI